MPPLQRVWDKYMAHKLLGPPQFGVIARIDAGLVLLVALGKEEKVSQCCKLYDIHLLPPPSPAEQEPAHWKSFGTAGGALNQQQADA